MNVLKAYTDAGALGQQGYNVAVSRTTSQRAKPARGRSGDFINISEEAREMFANGVQNRISALPQDATYDQNGQVMRQLDSLQGDLRNLAAQFVSQPGTAGLMPHIGAMQSRLASIRTQV